MALLLTLALCVGLLPSVALADGLADEGSIAAAPQEDAGASTPLPGDETEGNGGIATYANSISKVEPIDEDGTVFDGGEGGALFEDGEGGAIRVKVTGAAGTLVSYTWYKCADANKSEPKEASTGSSTVGDNGDCTIKYDVPSNTSPGMYYYYCAVTADGVTENSAVFYVDVAYVLEKEIEVYGDSFVDESSHNLKTWMEADSALKALVEKTGKFTYNQPQVSPDFKAVSSSGYPKVDNDKNDNLLRIYYDNITANVGETVGVITIEAQSDNTLYASVIIKVTVKRVKYEAYKIELEDWFYGDTENTPKPVKNHEKDSAPKTTDGPLYAVRGSDDFSQEVPKNAGKYTVKMKIAKGDAGLGDWYTKDFEIKPRPVTITGVTAVDRPYKKGNKEVELNFDNARIQGDAYGDYANGKVTINSDNASGRVDGDGGYGGSQTVIISDVELVGNAAKNYTLTQPTTTVNIEKANFGDLTDTLYVKNNTEATHIYKVEEFFSKKLGNDEPFQCKGEPISYDFATGWLDDISSQSGVATIKLNAVQAKPGDKIGTVKFQTKDTTNYDDVTLTLNLVVEGGNGGTTPTPNPTPNPGGNGGGNGGGSKHGDSRNSRSFWIFVEDSVHGEITSSHEYARSETQITLNAAPEEEFSLNWLSILTRGGDEVDFHDMGDGRYIFTMPASDVFVYSSFMDPVDFQDVPADAYYRDAVTWAAANRIVSGTSKNTFSPNDACTRAQIVTFLWRAAGCPEPTAAAGFADVAEDAYYARAVAWAVENGITGGTGNGLFSPDAPCTRAQAMAFLYRAMGQPETDGSAEFGDVPADAYYAKAVAWAAARGITSGVGEGLFGSDLSCTRAQIVSFLYRAH